MPSPVRAHPLRYGFPRPCEAPTSLACRGSGPAHAGVLALISGRNIEEILPQRMSAAGGRRHAGSEQVDGF